METIWFALVAAMLALYVVFDGFDLGAGAIHLLVARTDDERRLVLRSIGPVWDGNEVWLIAGGATLYFAFPALYATSFSGFYLPLMIVLWLLILRGIAIELRGHVDDPLWARFWDVTFSGASLLLALFYGAALGNVVRGVPLGADGRFFTPLWTDFRVGPAAGVLDWYTLTVALTALSALVLHGALWLNLKTEGALQARAAAVARRAWITTGLLTALVTIFTFRVQPLVPVHMLERALAWFLPLLAVTGWIGTRRFLAQGRAAGAFLASCGFVIGMMASAAVGLYPYVLPAITDPARGLTVTSAAAPASGLRIGLGWWLPGMLLVAASVAWVYRQFRGKVRLSDEGY
jgi:cytochrome d ubiquinol oxidase subunit II